MKTKINLPMHVAIIMDGNGRWAENRGESRFNGHKEGAKRVNELVSCAFNKGIKTLTLYAFSTENWARPKEEVATIFTVLENYFNNFAVNVANGKIRLRLLGERVSLPKNLVSAIEKCENETKAFTEFNLNIAINYGGRQEIICAVKNLVERGEEITEENFAKCLYTNGLTDPDLIIRTGGEYRLSNFMLFQGAYSELYFTDVLWPDFDENELEKAIQSFSGRTRRFGKVL